jgi:hypothetical protein
VWYRAIQQAEAGKTKLTVRLPGLSVPAMHQVTVNDWNISQMYKRIPSIRPFSFFTVLPPLTKHDIRLRRTSTGIGVTVSCDEDGQVIVKRRGRDQYDGLEGVSFFAPYASTFDEIKDQVRRADTGELMPPGVEFKTVAECVRDFLQHPEAKMANGSEVGVMSRRHLDISEQVFIGKESNQLLDEQSEDSEGVLGYPDAVVYSRLGFEEMLNELPAKEVARLTGTPLSTVYAWRKRLKPRGRGREAMMSVKIDR